MSAAIVPLTDRDREDLELRLLHGAIVERETWTAIAPLRREQLASARARRLHAALTSYYAEQCEPLGFEGEPLLAHGLRREDLDDLGQRIPVSSDAAPMHMQAIIRADGEQQRQALLRRAEAALHEGDAEAARELIDRARRHERSPIEWIGTTEIFQPLPPTPWVVRGLQLAPGRCHVIAGYGASAKTLSAQALALAVAAGRRAWDYYDTARGTVRHVDYEQGAQATRRRYQRLALGMGIDTPELGDRLELATMPRVNLDTPGAAEVYARACSGAQLVIVDSLRAATTADENTSEMRGAVDALTRVSEQTGTTVMLIHHAGKPQDRHTDSRTILRGSSGIYDAAGCVLVLTAGSQPNAPRKVTQAKQPADAAGGSLEPFGLAIEDVALAGDRAAGVRVVRCEVEADAQDADQYERDAERLVEAVKANPGTTKNRLVAICGLRKTRALMMLDALAEEGRVTALPGPRGATTYRLGGKL